MIPLKDDNPTKNKTYIRLTILIICTLVFFIQFFSKNGDFYTFYFGFKPSSLFQNNKLQTFFPLLTLITSIFMHGGWIHLIGNMLYLWIFADNIEDILGARHFSVFYILSGIFASLSQAMTNFQSDIPMIGASGAIAGVLGSYLYLFPKAKVLVLFPFIIFFTFRVSAYLLLIFWFIYQFLNLGGQNPSVAWVAHISGFIFGYLYSIIFIGKDKKRKKGKSIFLKEKGPWS